jgi:4-hydroxybenzoate polyprenyltransferase
MSATLFLRSMRPKQWTKNLFVLAPLLFGRKLGQPEAILAALAAAACFCLLAGALYVCNDIIDAPADRLHPEKRRRPVASGALGPPAAFGGAVAVVLAACWIAASLGRQFCSLAAAYAALSLAYSLALKRIVIVDVMAIAAGFVLRVAAGAAAVEVQTSHWLIICTFVLALFLGFSKRRQELLRGPGASAQRGVLGEYSVRMLEQINLVLAGTAVVCYMIYAVAPETVSRFGTDKLLYGTVFVFYGLMRYLLLLERPEAREQPEEMFLGDRPLLAAVFGWALYNSAVLYWPAIERLLGNWRVR